MTPTADHNGAERVLVLMPTPLDRQRAAAVLGAAGIACTPCDTVEHVCREMARGAGAVLLPEEAILRDREGRLPAALRDQPAWSSIPLVVLAHEGGDVRRESVLPGAAANVLLVGRPVRMRSLTSVVRAALQARRQQYEIRDAIAERERQAEALRESEARLRLMVESVKDYAIFSADTEGRVTTWNSGAERVFGWPEAEIIGRDVEVLFTPEDRQAGAPAEELTTAAGTGRAEDERWHIRRDGTRFFAAGVTTPVRDDAGRLVGFTKVARDVTDRKLAEEQLRSLTEELEQRVRERTAEAERRSAQLQALAEELTRTEQRERRRLATRLHDNLQQLLVAAKMRLQMLAGRAREPGAAELAREALDLIQESTLEARSLTTELSPPILHHSGLADSVRWLAGWMREKHALDVDVVAGPGCEPASQDTKLLLFEALRELLFNVVKHAGAKAARVELARAGDWLRYTVTDEGRGAASADRPAGNGDGGFGLFSIRARLDLLGGRAEFVTAPGGGFTARLLLPADRPAKGPADPPERAAHAGPPERPTTTIDETTAVRVLLVDDHRIVREGFARLLGGQSDIEIIGEAADGQAAVECARSLRPDVIVMDVNMPRMNGIEAARAIKHEMPGVRVIGLSLNEDDETARAMLEAGAVCYLTKGGPAEDLCRAIRLAAAGEDC